jgi:orotidine-5'-phosphate decarboxylase
MDNEDLQEAGYAVPADQLVMARALQAQQAGMPGLICSALEVPSLRSTLGPDMLLVTPGIRFAGGDAGDQKRVVTPEKAITDGADILVIGRPITAADDPKAAAHRAVEEIEAGLAARG